MSQAYYDDLSRLAVMTTADMRDLWDRALDEDSPDGISIEAIHEMLNARGDGAYCAV